MKSKIVTLLLALLFSCGLWLFVVTVEQPESENTYYDIPVIYQNDGEALLKERGLMIVSERPTVTLKLKSTRTNLRNLNESNINILVNLANITTAKEHKLNYTISYPGNVPSGEVSVVSASMEQISIKVEKRVTRPIPVEVEYLNSVPDPETMIALTEEIELDYAFIDVTGPESILGSKPEENKIAKAAIQVDLEGQSQTIAGEYPYTLCDTDGVPIDSSLLTTNVEAVNLVLKIQRVKEIELRVKVTPGGGATEATSTIQIDPGKIRVSGPEALLEDLEYLELGTIDLGTMTKAETVEFDVVLPEGVTNETGVTKAKVDVTFPNLRTRKISVTDIKIENLPEGLEAELITESMELTLRGLAEQVDALKASDLTVTVDLADAQPGTFTKGVSITVDSKYPDVGTMGTYSVSVTVKEATEEENK